MWDRLSFGGFPVKHALLAGLCPWVWSAVRIRPKRLQPDTFLRSPAKTVPAQS